MGLRRSHAACGLGLLPLAALLACAPQVDSGYRGEPMATLSGVVASSSALTTEADLHAAIVWLAWREGADGPEPKYIGERVAVDGRFPASFSLKLFAPPPPEAEVTTTVDYCADAELASLPAERDCLKGQLVRKGTGAGFWAGYLAAIDADTARGEVQSEDIIGIDVDHMLFYSDHASDEPEPAKPTPKDLVKIHEFISVGYDYEYDPGYHLLAINPARQALALRSRDCYWKGMCVQWLGTGTHQDYSDWEFQRCQERFPDNPTCSAFVKHAADGEPESSKECRDRYESTADRNACTYATSEPDFLDSRKARSTPIKIQLGRGLFDVMR